MKKKRTVGQAPPAAVHPFLEVVEPVEWEINSVPDLKLARISLSDHTAFAPVGDSEADLLTRNILMGQAAWSPDSIHPDILKQVSLSLLKAVEAARINLLLQSKQIDTSAKTLSENELNMIEDSLKDKPFIKKLEAATAFIGRGDSEALGNRLLGEVLNKSLTKLAVRIWKGEFRKGPAERWATFDRFTIPLASFLQTWMGEEIEKKKEAKPLPPDPEGDRLRAESLLGSSKDVVIQEIMGSKPERLSSGSARWGTMEIVSVDLDESLHRKIPAPRSASTDVGYVPRHLHRFYVDQKVFHHKRVRPEETGTVLVDCSGSMRLQNEEVEEIVRLVPAAQVALYAGDIDETTGRLIVVANKRRKSRDVTQVRSVYLGPLNIIDGPALDWLGKQPGPRFWISDGCVTGLNEDFNASLILDSANKCRQYHIKRHETLKSLLNYLKQEGG